MAVLWTFSSCFFLSRFPSLLCVAFFVLPSTEHIDGMAVLSLRGMPYCRYSSYFLVLGILVGRVSRSRLSTSSRPLLPCSILLFSTNSKLCEHGLGEHCFRGGLVGQLFLEKWFCGCSRHLSAKSHWLVLCRFHSLEATRTSQATPGVSVARLVPWVFFPVHTKGGSGLGFQRNLELAFSNLSVPAVP